MELDAELDRLYGLPLGEFVSARDELAKGLRAEDRREEAEQVKALRKPSVAAWLVNRLSRERELDVQRLLKAGETLRKAQADAAAGETEAFADARRDEHAALERLAEGAREIAVREGSGQAAVAAATQTLRAASLTDEGRELVKRGRLTEELEPPGFEALTGLVPAQPRKRPAKAPPRPKRPSKKALERVRRLQQAERTAHEAARAAEKAAEEARAKAEGATAEREAAERELES
jgi:hypothetical protein